jgi:hypothetical protein
MSYHESFLSFWKLYPRRIGKRHALKAFDAAVKRGTPVADILKGAEIVAQQVKAGNLELAYTKYPSTWLNGDCWEDEHLDPEPAYQRPQGPRRTWAEIQAELKKDAVG